MVTLILAILVAFWSVAGLAWIIAGTGFPPRERLTRLDWTVAGPLVWLMRLFMYVRDEVLP